MENSIEALVIKYERKIINAEQRIDDAKSVPRSKRTLKQRLELAGQRGALGALIQAKTDIEELSCVEK